MSQDGMGDVTASWAWLLLTRLSLKQLIITEGSVGFQMMSALPHRGGRIGLLAGAAVICLRYRHRGAHEYAAAVMRHRTAVRLPF